MNKKQIKYFEFLMIDSLILQINKNLNYLKKSFTQISLEETEYRLEYTKKILELAKENGGSLDKKII